MTDMVSDILTSFVVAIIITVPIMVVILLSGVTENLGKWTMPVYQIALVVWTIITIAVFGFLRSNEPKMYES